jgi:hypothetical protein
MSACACVSAFVIFVSFSTWPGSLLDLTHALPAALLLPPSLCAAATRARCVGRPATTLSLPHMHAGDGPGYGVARARR